jgi:ABC-2 type transport system ATP-binding protein
MSAIIEIQGLTKQYGSLTALQDLHLTLEEGDVFGFIGPNGAGKTTTMRILTTLLKPTSGKARVAGCSVLDDPARCAGPSATCPTSSASTKI